MFSQTVEYALRAMVHLAREAPASCTTEQIAQAMQVPKAYLSKVLQALVRAGLVNSQRGLGGGMTLSREACELNLFEAVQAVDPIQRIRACPLGLAEHAEQLCPLHRRLDEALASVEKAFRATTLDQLLEPDASGYNKIAVAGATARPASIAKLPRKLDKKLLNAQGDPDMKVNAAGSSDGERVKRRGTGRR